MGRKLLNRRAMLKGIAGASIGLPLLGAMGDTAFGATNPKRFIVFFTPNGTVLNNWKPAGSGANFTLSPILQPLAAHKDDLLVLHGIEHKVAINSPGSAHQAGVGAMLTCRKLQDNSLFQGGNGELCGWGDGISVDQEIANHIGTTTPFKSLEFAVGYVGDTVNQRINYLGPAQPIPPERDPVAMFNRIFGDVQNAPPDRLTMQRLSVLDAVKERYQMLNNQLGAEDRQRLEAHLSAVEAVENKIANFSSVDPGCAVPAVPNVDTGPTSIPQRGDAMMDLLVAALACDMTRVATLQWSGGVSGMVHHWLGHTEGHHDLSHQTSAQAQQQLTEINIWFAQQLASLIDRLKATPYGNGTLFDDVTILWCNELSDGKAHSHNPMAHVLAGSCGGYFNTGRFIDYPNMQQRQGDLMVSLLNAMDVPATTFGMPQYCSGPLPNLT